MVAISDYDVYPGQPVRLRNSFYDENDVLTDPTTVSLIVELPDGTSATYTYPDDISKESAGIFYYDVDTPSFGDYDYRWVGTGAVPAVYEGSFNVKKSKVS